jgi:hypothetical protein
MKWCKEDIEQVHIISWTCSISCLHHFMDLLDILFTSFHGFALYALYIISWTFSISSLHHFMYLLDILFTSFDGLARYHLYIISWTYSISSLHHFERGYRVSPWNHVKRLSSKSMKWSKEDIEQIHKMM